MGSKRAMLQNGLAEILRAEADHCNRVVDLFCGGSSVSWFAATELRKSVIAYDLQHYAVCLANAVIDRTDRIDDSELEESWLQNAMSFLNSVSLWQSATELSHKHLTVEEWQRESRSLALETHSSDLPITRSYGGYYFSIEQALVFDALVKTLPVQRMERNVCLAAAIIAASQCAAAPGHTAQPFKANASAGRYVLEAWQRSPIHYVGKALKLLCPMHAFAAGQAHVKDANIAVKGLEADDLVFVDPPYSSVHYSRFYHVLETIAVGNCGEVTGAGRYPPQTERPSSAYSMKGQSKAAMTALLKSLSDRGCSVVLTFPRNVCSNGLAGSEIEAMSAGLFHVNERYVKSRFSTLGGANASARGSRRISEELMLVLRPL